MNVKSSALAAVLVIAAAVPATTAGPIAYGICQTGCNAVAVACYAGAGAVMGTVTAGVGTPVAVLACNVALGQCSAACATVALFAPTP
ncbi:hypothetical protein PYCCODRAFT_842717 [Trametes coccinea BRFM310]|uniref:Cysteine-rich protein n=1 Tax=Trametes coccinea (strain BRFM310) TaxID=1353009 RepID=A0A1Y2IE67_TRAC3|nr:hypothetical protein PYCCODRAFT_842717 [Trametes coccinea BRFM310]